MAEKKSRETKLNKLFEILKHNLIMAIIIFIIVFSVIVIGSNVIVKEGTIESQKSVSSPQFIDSSLLGYWRFNNNSANDSSPNAKHGQLIGNAAAPADVLELNGSASNYVNISNISSTTLSKATYGGWFYLKSYGANGPIVLNGGTPAGQRIFNIHIQTSGAVLCGRENAWNTTGAGVVPLNTWAHIICVNNGSSVAIYKNGVLNSFFINMVGAATIPSVTQIGKFIGGSGYELNGFADDIVIFNRDLADWEIAQLYNSQQKSNVQLSKLTVGAADIYWDGNKLVFVTNKTSPFTSTTGIAWFSSNISSTGYMTRTTAWDTVKYGNALDYIRNDYIGVDGKIDHSKYSPIEKADYEVTDYEDCNYVQSEEINPETGEKNIRQVCATKIEEGVLLDGTAAKHEQAIYELKKKIEELEARLVKLGG